MKFLIYFYASCHNWIPQNFTGDTNMDPKQNCDSTRYTSNDNLRTSILLIAINTPIAFNLPLLENKSYSQLSCQRSTASCGPKL